MSLIGGDYDLRGGVCVIGDGGSSSFSFSRSIYITRHTSAISRSVPPKLLRKRPTPHTQLSRSKLSVPQSRSITTHHRPEGPMADNKHSELIQSSGYRTCLDKQPQLLSTLSLEAIFSLQDTFEGHLYWSGISSEEVSKWERAYPGVLENKKIRQEYNFLNESFIIKCSTLPTHEAPIQFFTASLQTSLVEQFGAKEAKALLRISAGRGMLSHHSSYYDMSNSI